MTTLVFDDLDTLRAALDAGLVPTDVQAGAVAVEIDDDGCLQVETKVEISRVDQKALRDAGVQFRRRSLHGAQTLGCWAEILPVQPAPEPEPPLGEVLFVSEGDEGFLRISGELLRLGSEDQRLAFFTDEHGVRRNLCRVPDPPYYAILRAFDRDDPLRAFVPARPGSRVWLELGASHPLAGRLDGQPGQLILIPRPPGRGQRNPWLRVPDGPWVDLHSVTNVALPVATTWTPHKPSVRLQVALRLVRAPSKRPADLWVLRERALEQVEQLVRTVPEDITMRLRFAIIEHEDPASGGTQTQVVLRARRSAAGPPALQLDAEAYVPVPQIPDLYLPVGTILDPPLRPNRLRELFGGDQSRIMWLAPAAEQGTRGRAFTRESLPESGFAPLSEWVDYLVGAHEARLEPWVRSAMFDFDKYVSIGVEWEEGAAPPPKPKRKRDDEGGRRREPLPTAEPTPDFPGIDFDAHELAIDQAAPIVELAPIEMPRNEVEQQLAALEHRFCELDTPLDDPARPALWAELGNLHAALHRSREAALCWSRALWEQTGVAGPSQLALARRWVECECAMLGFGDGGQLLGIVDVVESDLDEQMVRALAAEVVYIDLAATTSLRGSTSNGAGGAAPAQIPTLGGEMLARLQRFFLAHGSLLDLRTLWLARSALARRSGDDRLALFQTRDAIMAALREGIGLARNIPTFVRTHGSDGDASDLDRIGDELLRVRDEYLTTKRNRSTIEASFPNARTDAYVRMVFAWGFARIGRAQVAREELDAAQSLFNAVRGPGKPGATVESARADGVHVAAHAAYLARVEQALEGMPPGAPFSAAPDGPIAARERLGPTERFKYNRIVQGSRVLDPRQDVDAFDKWMQKADEPFAGLELLSKPEALSDLFDRMLATMQSLGPVPRARALGELLEFLEALPEPLAVPRMRAALQFIRSTPLEAQPKLLRNALLLAGYYDRSDLIAEVLATLARSDADLTANQPAKYAELLGRCAPVLRRSNYESEIAALLTKLEERVAGDNGLASVIARVHIAAAFASLGQSGRVHAAFVSALALLPELTAPADHQALLREISVALSRSSPGQAIAGARTLMEQLANTSDSMSTNSHYCLAVIHLMEAVVTALASEDLVLSEWARRWIEEDEHLLHRRIHRDLAVAR
jgi:hypothetical protein